ncbi:EAL domain-containing protein [Pseudomonas canadensis]|uniref:EAL domain-containing protein n=1 Tax=Pseudomonas canadensis TaxID=915099 RepID=UPI003BA3D073
MNTASPTECLEQTVAYFQPQFSVITGDLFGAEALARWNHKKLGILGPFHFLPMMHSVALRRALWERMLSQTLDMLTHQQHHNLCIGVNVSADVASSDSWAESVAHQVSERNIKASTLAIEVTEDGGDGCDAGLAESVNTLRQLGFDCAIDDFGTGFSSLQRLAVIPFSTLKIDKGFVWRARSSSVDRKILNNTVALAHDLGLSVTAEGVETEEDFQRVAKLGCEVAQGYYFAKPMPADQFIAYSQNQIQYQHQKDFVLRA